MLRALGSAVFAVAACTGGPLSPTTAPIAPPPGAVVADAAVAETSPTLPCPRGAAAAAVRWPRRGATCQRSGVADGPFVELHPSGAIATRGAHRSGKLDGRWRRYAPDGSLVEDGAYDAGLATGIWRQLRPDGVELGRYAMDRGAGLARRWNDDGLLARETGWMSGRRHGGNRARTANGTVWLDEHWVDGVRDGVRIMGSLATIHISETWRSGILIGDRTLWRGPIRWLEERYDEQGRLSGPWTAFRSLKLKREQGAYLAGTKQGRWTWFDRRGSPEKSGMYVGGKRDGVWKTWRDRRLSWTGTYSAGVPNGRFIEYDRRGRETGRYQIVAGRGTQQSFHPGGAVSSETELHDGRPDGRHEEYYARGAIAMTGQYAAGQKTGEWTSRWPSGQLRTVETYRAGQRHGNVRNWRASGALAVEATYVDGLRHGPYRESYPNGQPALTGTYVRNHRNASWKSWSPTGVLQLDATWKNGLLDGAWQEFHANGAVAVTGQHRAGHRVGPWHWRDLDGALLRTEDYGQRGGE